MKQLWQVKVRDKKYSGESDSLIGVAKDAADAATKALKKVQADYKRDGNDGSPYVLSVESIGAIEF